MANIKYSHHNKDFEFMTDKKSILIICNSDLAREPRVIRQIIALKDHYKITTFSAEPSSFNELDHISFINKKESPNHWKYPVILRKIVSLALNLFKKGKSLYPKYYYHKDFWTQSRKDLLTTFENKRFDLIIAHHWDSLPVGAELAQKWNARLIYNVHDYYERQFEDNPVWVNHQQPLVQYLTDRYVPHCDYLFSAWTKIHEDYQKRYNVPSVIINNATEFNDLAPVINTDKSSIRIIHHGIANSNRKIELMIKMMDFLDERFTLDLMLINSPYEMDYFNDLKKLASKNVRINFIPPVPTRQIPKEINGYDIGVFILPPNGFNPTHLLPNKLFEFIQARITCLVTPNYEMKTIVEKYSLGWISEDFNPASVAGKIKNITRENINNIKINVHQHAYTLSAEINYAKMKETVDSVFHKKIIKKRTSPKINIPAE